MAAWVNTSSWPPATISPYCWPKRRRWEYCSQDLSHIAMPTQKYLTFFPAFQSHTGKTAETQKNYHFSFDRVFGPQASQHEVNKMQQKSWSVLNVLQRKGFMWSFSVFRSSTRSLCSSSRLWMVTTSAASPTARLGAVKPTPWRARRSTTWGASSPGRCSRSSGLGPSCRRRAGRLGVWESHWFTRTNVKVRYWNLKLSIWENVLLNS